MLSVQTILLSICVFALVLSTKLSNKESEAVDQIGDEEEDAEEKKVFVPEENRRRLG